jgi:uncharacterized protein
MASWTRLSGRAAFVIALGLAPIPILGQPALPPPVEQTSANCAAPTYASDQFVCAHPELLELDRRMAGAQLASLRPKVESELPLTEAQTAWFRRRSLCAMKKNQAACLTAAYQERIAVLEGLTMEPTSAGPNYECSFGSSLGMVQLAVSQNGVAILSQNNAPIGIGLVNSDPRIWTPFVTVTKHGKSFSIAIANVTRALCPPTRLNVPEW